MDGERWRLRDRGGERNEIGSVFVSSKETKRKTKRDENKELRVGTERQTDRHKMSTNMH